MANLHQPALLLAALLATSVPSHAQDAPPPFDPKTALAEALHRLDASDADTRRYTYVQKITMATVARSGRLIDGTTRKYEALYINDHQYLKLIEVDDKPLAGSALKDEQKRYDKAIARKKELDREKRAGSDEFTYVKPDFDPAAVLTPAYTLKEISTSTTPDGDLLHVIDATLVPGAKHKSKCPWQARLWISGKTGILTRYATSVPGNASEECAATGEEKRYLLIDGLPKIASEARRLNVNVGYNYEPHEFLIAYTNYRRFHATVTLGEATELPDETSPPPPPDTPK